MSPAAGGNSGTGIPPLEAKDSPRGAYLGFILPVLIVALGATWRGHVLFNHDVAWFLTAAGRMLAGGTYATDFFEVNMPQAIAAYIPPHWLSHGFGISLLRAQDLWVFALILQSAVLCMLVRRRSAEPRPPCSASAALLASWLLACMIFLPGYDFGQREHLLAILGLPFLFLLARDDRRPGQVLRIYISLLGAIGFFLKPHYVPLPALLLGTAAVRQRSWRPLLGVEGACVVAVAAAETAAVLLAYPDWLQCARWARDLYGAYRIDGWSRMLGARGLPVVMAALAFQILLLWRGPALRASALPFVAAAAYAWLAYLLQFKGWSYHFLATAIIALAGQGIAVAECLNRARRVPRPWSLAAVGIAAVAVALTAEAIARRTPDLASLGKIPEALSIAGTGDYVYAFSLEVSPIFPAVQLRGLNWASRYSPLWPLPGLLRAQAANDDAGRALLARYRAPFVQSVLDDFARYQPSLVVVDRHAMPEFGAGFDILSLFLADPRFAKLWAGYSLVGSVTYPGGIYGYELYVREGAAQ